MEERIKTQMMWTVAEKVRKYVEKFSLIEDGDVLVAGISGGADSVCLFYLLKELQRWWKFRFVAVHVNHGLRGEEAEQDEKYVEKICMENEVPFRNIYRNVGQMAREMGLSTEEAGRKARYEIFENVMREIKGTKIVLAHHQDDQAETMIHHLARGTGISGLCGLKPVSGNRIRPLLCLKRKEIEEYLKEKGITWQTDSTNLDDAYTRNKIRHHVVSYLCEEINTEAVSHMARTAEELREIEELLQLLTEEKIQQMVERHSDYGRVSEVLRKEPDILQRRVLLEEIKRIAGSSKDFTRTHAEDVKNLWNRQVGKKIMLPCGVTACRGYDAIWIQKEAVQTEQGGKDREIFLMPCEKMQEISFGGITVNYQVISNEFAQIPEKKYTKWLDYDIIKDSVVIRHRKPGDRMGVLFSGGSKKLKDYLIDRKIPQKERDNLWLLAVGQDILWIVGDRISEKYKVTNTTRQILHIQIKGGMIHE